jgi:hypothetical protein
MSTVLHPDTIESKNPDPGRQKLKTEIFKEALEVLSEGLESFVELQVVPYSINCVAFLV